MTRNYSDESELPTVLDRLLYRKPKADERRGRDSDLVLASIARDLEALLNSRCHEDTILADYAESCTSILNFGVPEFDQYGNLASTSEQNRLCKVMETSIRLFEPRLSGVSVRMIAPGKRDFTLRFRIEATIGALGEKEVFEAGLKRESNIVSVSSGVAA